MKELPSPDFGGPSSMFHDDGASTEVTESLVSSRAWITAGNGSRTSPEKLNPEPGSMKLMGSNRRLHLPKMASTTWSVDSMAEEKLSVKGTLRSSNCLASR